MDQSTLHQRTLESFEKTLVMCDVWTMRLGEVRRTVLRVPVMVS